MKAKSFSVMARPQRLPYGQPHQLCLIQPTSMTRKTSGTATTIVESILSTIIQAWRVLGAPPLVGAQAVSWPACRLAGARSFAYPLCVSEKVHFVALSLEPFGNYLLNQPCPGARAIRRALRVLVESGKCRVVKPNCGHVDSL